MKYEIEIMVATIAEDNKDEIRNEPFYYLAESEEINRRDFDEDSLKLFGAIDV